MGEGGVNEGKGGGSMATPLQWGCVDASCCEGGWVAGGGGGIRGNSGGALTEHVLGAGGADDDLGPHGGDADLDAGVAVLSELTHEELVELGVEDAIGHELQTATAAAAAEDQVQ